MKPLLILLLGSTLGLAIACLYLASELRDERARGRSARQPNALEQHVSNPSGTRSGAIRSGAMAPVTENADLHWPQAKDRTATPFKPKANSNDAFAQLIENSRSYRAHRLQGLADPTARSRMRLGQEPGIRRLYRGLANALDLTPAEEEGAIELLTELDLENEEFNYRVQGERDREKVQRAVEQFRLDQRNELVSLLGEEKTQRLEHFQETTQERMQMNALRARLDGANQLSDDQERRLITQMQEERTRFLDSLHKDQAGGYLGEYPFTPVSMSDDPAERLARDKANLEKTEDFLRRVHERAAAVLTAEQLRRFDEIQAEQLNGARLGIQREEAALEGQKVPW